jgi:uncharacterized protein (DUF1778 family)
VKDEEKTEVINRRGAIAMTKANARVFAEALANPPEPSAPLRKAAAKYQKAIDDGELEIVE